MKSLSIMVFLFTMAGCQELVTSDLVRIEGNWNKSSTVDICPSSEVASHLVYFSDLDVDGVIDQYTEDAETKYSTSCTLETLNTGYHDVRNYNLSSYPNSYDFVNFVEEFYADFYSTNEQNVTAEILTFSEYKINYLLSVTSGHRLSPFTENITLTK